MTTLSIIVFLLGLGWFVINLHNPTGWGHVMATSILFIAANPTDSPRLRIDEEFREIKNVLKGRKQFVLHEEWAVQVQDFRRALLTYRPRIVQFSCHGDQKGLILEDKNGKAVFVDAEALAELFGLCSDTVECVVLNSCDSQVQAKKISQYVDHVIAFNREVQDKAATVFAVGMFDALVVGKSLEQAFYFGANALKLAGFSAQPILIKKGSIMIGYQIKARRFVKSGDSGIV